MKYIITLLGMLPGVMLPTVVQAETTGQALPAVDGQGAGNVAIIRQGGGNNRVSITQKGSDNVAEVFQQGKDNAADVTQEGAHNQLNATQMGESNELTRTQSGHSVTTINQNGAVSTHEHNGTAQETYK